MPKSHVYRLARGGAIPTVQVGRYRRFRLDAIERWEVGGETTPTTPARAPAAGGA